MSNKKSKPVSTKKITLKDIAAETGYTVNTVSHALNDREDISEITKQKIKQKAFEMGYIKNTVASSMRTGLTKTLAVIMSDISNPFFGIMVKLIEDNARLSGYNTIIINTDEDPELETSAIYSALEKNVDGIILCPTQKNEDSIHLLQNSSCPFVLLGRHFQDQNVDFITTDDVHGAFIATEHLINFGFKNILMLSGPSYISSAAARLQGYKNALEKHNLSPKKALLQHVPVTGGGCYSIIEKLIKSKVHFDSVFAFSDLVALEALSILHDLLPERYTSIPIIGYDNILSNMRLPYPLSSVSYDKNRMAELLVSTLLSKIMSKGSGEAVQIFLPTELILRC